jgi:hypothetical protein
VRTAQPASVSARQHRQSIEHDWLSPPTKDGLPDANTRGMFRIILRPDERALLERIRKDRRVVARDQAALIARLSNFGMLTATNDGALCITDLGEAGLARMNGEMH